MLESEAKTKECCGGLSWTKEILDNSQSATPMVVGYETSTKCIGSRCMAWRFHVTVCDPPIEKDGKTIFTETTGGYCGLAGK